MDKYWHALNALESLVFKSDVCIGVADYITDQISTLAELIKKHENDDFISKKELFKLIEEMDDNSISDWDKGWSSALKTLEKKLRKEQ